MLSVLTIYKSAFKNPDGSRGVVGDPHKVFFRNWKIFSSNNLKYIEFPIKSIAAV